MTASERFENAVAAPASDDQLAGVAPISIREVGELRASIPYLLGFYPERSLVIIGLGANNAIVVTVRIDAPMQVAEVAPTIEQVSLVLSRCAPQRLLVAYCDDYELSGPEEADVRSVEARRAYETVRDLAPVIERELGDRGYPCMLLWPAQPGAPRATNGPVPQIAVAHAVAGRALLRSRAALVETLRPIRGAARAAVRQRLTDLSETVRDRIDLVALTADILEKHAEATAAGQAAPPMEPGSVALCIAALEDIGARDILITMIAQEHDWWRTEPWVRTVQLAPTKYVTPAATMLGIVAYLMGDGALAQTALDKALRHDPDYSLARMIDSSLRLGLHPTELRRVLASTFEDELPI